MVGAGAGEALRHQRLRSRVADSAAPPSRAVELERLHNKHVNNKDEEDNYCTKSHTCDSGSGADASSHRLDPTGRAMLLLDALSSEQLLGAQGVLTLQIREHFRLHPNRDR